jgi:hypothetical protein
MSRFNSYPPPPNETAAEDGNGVSPSGSLTLSRQVGQEYVEKFFEYKEILIVPFRARSDFR